MPDQLKELERWVNEKRLEAREASSCLKHLGGRGEWDEGREAFAIQALAKIQNLRENMSV